MGGDTYLERLRAACGAYLAQMERLEMEQRGVSIFGLGRKLGDAPCNKDFSRAVQALAEEMAAAGAASAEIRAVLEYLYRLPLDHRKPRAAYWMLRAVQSHTLALIGMLSADDAAALRAIYERDYPRSDRLPVQDQTLTALKKAERA